MFVVASYVPFDDGLHSYGGRNFWKIISESLLNLTKYGWSDDLMNRIN